MAVNDVPSPSAEIAVKRAQGDASIKGALTLANIEAKPGNAGATLFNTHSATKTRANMGIGILPAVATARRANNQPITSTNGSIKKTRNSFTTTAVLPAVSETAYPAPTTCATSWIVAPSMTPVVCGSNPSRTQTSG